ncbi:MAG: hypothetical protein PHX83_14490 [Acidobacteriia bacterium]|nr:hypothetical protein [Terriglobia bacterium]
MTSLQVVWLSLLAVVAIGLGLWASWRSRRWRQRHPESIVNVVHRQTKRRRSLIGLGMTTVEAGATATIFVFPQRLFELLSGDNGRSIFLPSTVARSFVILSIKIGQDEQLLAEGCVPADTFGDEAIPFGMVPEFRAAMPGERIELVVKNIGSETLIFMGALCGWIVEDL